MTTHKVSLMEAYQIETLRNEGITKEEIIKQVKTGNVTPWQKVHEKYDFSELLELANQDLDVFEEILSSGYQVKFVTFKGLKNLLQMRLGKVEDKDYRTEEKGIRDLTLTEKELQQVKQMLSRNWVIEEQKDSDHVVDIMLATS